MSFSEDSGHHPQSSGARRGGGRGESRDYADAHYQQRPAQDPLQTQQPHRDDRGNGRNQRSASDEDRDRSARGGVGAGDATGGSGSAGGLHAAHGGARGEQQYDPPSRQAHQPAPTAGATAGSSVRRKQATTQPGRGERETPAGHQGPRQQSPRWK